MVQLHAEPQLQPSPHQLSFCALTWPLAPRTAAVTMEVACWCDALVLIQRRHCMLLIEHMTDVAYMEVLAV